MARVVRVGIIGSGAIAPVHAHCYRQIDGVEVAWACDLVEEKAAKLAKDYSIPGVTTSYRDLLNDSLLDAVSVCTDHASHSAIVVEALDSGKHVLCEKPLGTTVKGLDAMMAAHRRNSACVFSGVFQHRFDPEVRYVKELLDQKALGEIVCAVMRHPCLRTDEYYRADAWRGKWATEGGGVLINQSIHFLDTLNWLMGGITAVCASWANLGHTGVIEVEDTIVASIQFGCGALGTYAATTCSHLDWEPVLSIYGTKGSIDITNCVLSRAKFVDAEFEAEVLAEFGKRHTVREQIVGKSYYGTQHPEQLADFVDAIRAKRPPFVTGESARKTVDVVLAIYKSAKEKKWVEVRA